MIFPHHHTNHLTDKMCDQFVLRWHYHDSTLLGNLPTLLESNVLTDMTISVGDSFLRAHKVVLALCSTYFFQLFQEMNNSQNPVIVLHNVNLEDMKAVLQYIYKGQCVVTKEQLPSLLSVAKLLKIQGLCDMKVPENADKCENGNISVDESNNSDSTNLNVPKIEESDKTKVEIIQPDTLSERSFPNEITNLKRSSMASSCSTLWETSILGSLPPPAKKAHKELPENCKCFLCGKYLSNQYNLRVHIETHEEAYHACKSCPHVSRSRDALRKHISYRHPEEYHSRKRKKTTHEFHS